MNSFLWYFQHLYALYILNSLQNKVELTFKLISASVRSNFPTLWATEQQSHTSPLPKGIVFPLSTVFFKYPVEQHTVPITAFDDHSHFAFTLKRDFSFSFKKRKTKPRSAWLQTPVADTTVQIQTQLILHRLLHLLTCIVAKNLSNSTSNTNNAAE